MPNSILNDLVVVKRSGQRVEFNSLKIAIAIKKAFDSLQINDEKTINTIYEDTLKNIIANYQDRKTINVENIQDIIETTLKEDNYLDVYQAFSEYRVRRAASRQAFSEKQQHKFVKVIESIGSISIEGQTPHDLLTRFGRAISKEYAKSYILDNKYVKACEEGIIYIHNLPYLPLGYFLNAHLMIEETLTSDHYFYDTLELLLSSTKEINGEIAVDNFDVTLSSYILSYFKNIFTQTLTNYLNLTGFIDYINSKKINEIINKMSSIKLDSSLFISSFLNEKALSVLNNAYEDTLNNLTTFLQTNLNHLLTSLASSNHHYSISLSTIDTHETNLIRSVILNIIGSQTSQEDLTIIIKIDSTTSESYLATIANLIINNKNITLSFSSSYNLDINQLSYFSNGYRLYENNFGPANSNGRILVANTSLNLTRLALKYPDFNSDFYEELDNTLELTKNELLSVFENLGDRPKENYQTLFNHNIYDDEKLEEHQHLRKVIKNGTLNINLIGLKEIETMRDSAFVITLLSYIKKKIETYGYASKLNFTLSAINEHQASTSLIEIDKTVFGLIPNLTKKDYYDELSLITNLNRLDNLDTFAQYQKLLNGGNTLYLNLAPNITTKKISEIINNLLKSDIGYAKFIMRRQT